MPSPITISIDVPAYLKQYLLIVYGPAEPIQFKYGSEFNTFLIRRVGRPRFENPEYIPKSMEKVRIQLPYTRLKNWLFNHYLSYDDQLYMRQQIEFDFNADFVASITDKMNQGYTRKEATELFMEDYNITEEQLSFSAFYRKYSRRCEKRRLTVSQSVIKKNSLLSSQICPK